MSHVKWGVQTRTIAARRKSPGFLGRSERRNLFRTTFSHTLDWLLRKDVRQGEINCQGERIVRPLRLTKLICFYDKLTESRIGIWFSAQ